MKQSGTEADNDQNKGNNYDAFYNHDVITLARRAGILGYSGVCANRVNKKSMLIKIGNRTLRLEMAPTLAYLCLLPVLLALGNWQLGRAEAKRELIQQQQQRAASDVLDFTAAIAADAEALRYRRVEITGQYDPAHQFLLDNQISEGKAGYYILTPFLVQGTEQAVLINRGWVPVNRNRLILPDLPIHTLETTLTGRINYFPVVGIKLAGAEIPGDGWPSLVQVADSEMLAKKLGYALLPFQVELDKDLADGFKREWQTATVMPPEQHIAYALQWFGLALTLTILFFWYSFKKQ